MRKRKKHDDVDIALANFSLTFAKALLVFCVILFLMINPSQKTQDGIKPKMEYLITLSWPKELDYDVDIWIKDPDGKILYYENKEVGLLNLERDDLGTRNNSITVQGKEVVVVSNEELVSIRGFKPGEYIINAHLYSGNKVSNPVPVEPFNVTVTIQKMNPNVIVVYQGTATIQMVRQEVHLVRFNLTSDGFAKNFTNELPVNLREKINEHMIERNSSMGSIPGTGQ